MNENVEWWILTIFIILIIIRIIYDIYILIISKDAIEFRYTNGVFLAISIFIGYMFTSRTNNFFSDTMQKISAPKEANVAVIAEPLVLN
jgi:hypothetical protein